MGISVGETTTGHHATIRMIDMGLSGGLGIYGSNYATNGQHKVRPRNLCRISLPTSLPLFPCIPLMLKHTYKYNKTEENFIFRHFLSDGPLYPHFPSLTVFSCHLFSLSLSVL